MIKWSDKLDGQYVGRGAGRIWVIENESDAFGFDLYRVARNGVDASPVAHFGSLGGAQKAAEADAAAQGAE